MSDEVGTVVNDTNLSPAACRVVLYVRSLGSEAHEIKQTKFMALLNHPGEKAVRTAVQLAVDVGYLEQTPGGRGHSDRYNFRLPPADSLSDRPAPQDSLSGHRPAPRDSLKPTVVVGDVNYVEGDEDAGASEPLEPKAAEAIEHATAKLNGCRGALRDYLSSRVPKDQQYGYVQTVVTWIDNPLAAFRTPNGLPVPAEERTGLLALALNEMSATDETTRKHKRGDPANLRTKLGFVIRDRYSKTEARGPPRGDQPPDANTYDPNRKPYSGELNG